MAFLDKKYLLESEVAFMLYNEVAGLPVIDAHNHADVAQIAKNTKFKDPWQLFAATDHYVWEMLRKRGVKEKYITGDATPREKWMELGRVFPEFVGNPIYEWIHLDLRMLGITDTLLSGETAEEIWEQAKAVLQVKSNSPMELIKRMNIEAMCSTDDPVDSLEYHEAANKALGKVVIHPTWRPDKAVNAFAPDFRAYLVTLEKRFNRKIDSVKSLVETLQESHDYFASHGCLASDHGMEYPFPGEATEQEADAVLKAILAGKKPTRKECDLYSSYLMAQLAEMDAKKNWVFQMHIGAVRNVRDSLMNTIGPDSGGDISDHMVDLVHPLCRFLNRFDDRLKVVLYCMDPNHQTSLATVSRAFGSKVRLGSAWWLNDTPVGMRRQLEYIGSVDLLFSFAGMVSDSRKLLSYSSRFEVFRRVLANEVACLVERGQMPLQLAIRVMKQMCYDGPKEFFQL